MQHPGVVPGMGEGRKPAPTITGLPCNDCWPNFVGVKRERDEDSAWAVQPLTTPLGMRSVVCIYHQTADGRKLELRLITDGIVNCGGVPLEDNEHACEWVRVHEQAREALAGFPFCFVEMLDGRIFEFRMAVRIRPPPNENPYRTLRRECSHNDPTYCKYKGQGWTQCSAEGGVISRAVHTCKITYTQSRDTRGRRCLEGVQNIYNGYEVFPEIFRISRSDPTPRNLRELEGVMVSRRKRCISLALEGLIKYTVKFRGDGESPRVSKCILHKIGLYAKKRPDETIADSWNTILARVGEYNAGSIMGEIRDGISSTVKHEPRIRHIKITEGEPGCSINRDEKKKMLRKFQFGRVIDGQTGRMVREEHRVIPESTLVESGYLLVHPKNGTPLEQLWWTDTFLSRYFRKSM